VLPVVALVVIGIAAALWLNRKGPGEVGELYGNVDIREVNLGFRVSGRVLEMLRDEGDPVKTGDVVARLDAEPLKRAADQARAQSKLAWSKLEQLQAGYRTEEVAQAESALREREASLVNSERVLQRNRELLAQKTVSQQVYDDSLAQRDVDVARRNSAQSALALLKAGYRREEVDQARAEFARAKGALAAAEIQVADTELKSAGDGVVITRAVEPGAIVQAGTTVLTVSLEKPVWVRVYVPEPLLGRLKPGLAVEVFTDSRKGKPYHGQVGYISPVAEFTPKSVETPDLRTSLVYRMRVVVTDADSGLRQGMPVTVTLPKP
jgi:HlyD family secretion protein